MYQPETEEWAEGVYLIEEEDDVLGFYDDFDGYDNLPLLDLANRTGYLMNLFGEAVGV